VVPLSLIEDLSEETSSKILFFVLDGLGGMPHPEVGKSELEVARIPNLDRFAGLSICGVTDPIAPGITPGSGPSHLALFGYNPIRFDIGRGVLSALGIDFPIGPNDVCFRANFATVDAEGAISDRRAGRLATELNRELCALLRHIHVPEVEVFVETESGHRALVVFRGEGLSDCVTDTDPQRTGVPPLTAAPTQEEAVPTAQIVNRFLSEAAMVLQGQEPANMLLLRGAASLPSIPTLPQIYKLSPGAIASYPMYRGLAKLVGMEVLETGDTIWDEFETLQQHWDDHDFFYFHVKATDTAGEDGDFNKKVQVLEEIDSLIPALLRLQPDVFVITGDHSSPSALSGHSWHPVPFALHSSTSISDHISEFTERALVQGSLGRFPAQDAMLLAMGHAQKLAKYGA
jgi:2,3-bisphosphoglycerate-independent phosphoglycerate mutase